MIDHIGFGCSDVAASEAFYRIALAPLGMDVAMRHESWVGFGPDGKPSFWIHGPAEPTRGLHVAFVAPDRASVDAFYAAAIRAGGRDNGAPGLRAHYHPNYYAAFVLDPDGNNVEAVCHAGN